MSEARPRPYTFNSRGSPDHHPPSHTFHNANYALRPLFLITRAISRHGMCSLILTAVALTSKFNSHLLRYRTQRYTDYTPSNYLTSMSTTSGLGSNYTTNTTSNLSGASSLSSHPNTSSPCRKCGSSSSGSEENMNSLAAYHQQQMLLSRSPYINSRVPQMGLSATGHRRTLSSNFSGYSQSYFGTSTPPPTPPIELQAAAVSKNPFLNMIQPVAVAPNRTYENVPFSPNRHLYAEFYERDTTTGTLRSSLKKKKSLPSKEEQQEPHQPIRVEESSKDQYSFSSSGSRVRFSPRSCSPSVEASYSSPSSS